MAADPPWVPGATATERPYSTLLTASRALRLGLLALGAVLALLAASGCGGSERAVAGRAPADIRLGIVLPSDFRETEQLAPALDVARIRMVWDRAQPNCRMIRRGRYDWRRIDRDVSRFAGRGIPLLVTIRGGPACASVKARGEALEPKRAYWDDFARFAAKVVGRYGPDAKRGGAEGCCAINQLEVWNEPNIIGSWSKPDGREYGRFLEVVSKRVRRSEASANVRIVSGGLAASNALEFTRELFSLKRIGLAFDDYGLHTYNPTPADALELVGAVRRRIRGSGDDTPIAITEHGWSTCARPSATRNRGKCTTRGGQARKLDEYVTGLRRDASLGVDAFFWYTPQDVAKPSNTRRCPTSPKYFYGFFDRDGKAKPVWERWVELTGVAAAAPDQLPPLPPELQRNCHGLSASGG